MTVGLGYGLRRFAELGVTPTEIRLTGGGSQSAAWRQICADVFGVPVVCLHSAEGAALGAAIQAAAAAERESGGATLETLADRLATLDESTRHLPTRRWPGCMRNKPIDFSSSRATCTAPDGFDQRPAVGLIPTIPGPVASPHSSHGSFPPWPA